MLEGEVFAAQSPAWPAKEVARLVASGRYRMGEDGLEKRCTKCSEWLPADTEFFYPSNRGGLHPWCAFCYREDRKAKREGGMKR